MITQEKIHQSSFNDALLELASDIAGLLTTKEGKKNSIVVVKSEMIEGTEHQTFTEEGQDIFNIYYDELTETLEVLCTNLASNFTELGLTDEEIGKRLEKTLVEMSKVLLKGLDDEDTDEDEAMQK